MGFSIRGFLNHQAASPVNLKEAVWLRGGFHAPILQLFFILHSPPFLLSEAQNRASGSAENPAILPMNLLNSTIATRCFTIPCEMWLFLTTSSTSSWAQRAKIFRVFSFWAGARLCEPQHGRASGSSTAGSLSNGRSVQTLPLRRACCGSPSTGSGTLSLSNGSQTRAPVHGEPLVPKLDAHWGHEPR